MSIFCRMLSVAILALGLGFASVSSVVAQQFNPPTALYFYTSWNSTPPQFVSPSRTASLHWSYHLHGTMTSIVTVTGHGNTVDLDASQPAYGTPSFSYTSCAPYDVRFSLSSSIAYRQGSYWDFDIETSTGWMQSLLQMWGANTTGWPDAIVVTYRNGSVNGSVTATGEFVEDVDGFPQTQYHTLKAGYSAYPPQGLAIYEINQPSGGGSSGGSGD